MADTIPVTPQNPFAAPGADPNAALFAASMANKPGTTVTAPGAGTGLSTTFPTTTPAGVTPAGGGGVTKPTGTDLLPGGGGIEAPKIPPLNAGGFSSSSMPFLESQYNQVQTNYKTAQDAAAAAKKAAQDEAEVAYQSNINDIAAREAAAHQSEAGATGNLNVNQGRLATGVTNDTASAEYRAKIGANFQSVYASLDAAKALALKTKGAALSDADSKSIAAALKAAQDQMSSFMDIYKQGIDEKNTAWDQAYKTAESDFQKKQYEQNRNDSAREWAFENGIKKPFYVVGQTAFDTVTGQPLSYDEYIKAGGKADFTNADILDPNSQKLKSLITSWADKYADAGIDPTVDTVESAHQKILNSPIYKDQIRPPSTGNGGGTNTDAIADKLRLAAGDDGFVDPGKYAQERATSKVKPGEFDLRYGYLLSPAERKNLNVYQNVERDTKNDSTSNDSLAE